ncbi:MAG: hypothetical protein V1888_03220 [archaeon]
MANKKVVKKVESKTTSIKAAPICKAEDSCYCKPILALLIIALAWWKPAVMWSQITITIAAAIIFLSGNKCYCKK